MNRFRGGLVFKAHRLLYHSTLGSRVIKKKKKSSPENFGTIFEFDAPSIEELEPVHGPATVSFTHQISQLFDGQIFNSFLFFITLKPRVE